MTHINIFDKQSSIAVKGLAVLMMVVLHMFAFPGRNGNLIESDFLGSRYTLAFGVCVSIYVFVAGYANGLMYKKFGELLWRKNLGSIKNLYFKFLSIAIPILAVIYIFNLTTVPNYGSTCQIASDLENIMGGGKRLAFNILLIRTSYCGEWWFLALYIELLLISFIIPRKTSKRTDLMILIVLFCIALASQYVYYDFGYLSVHIWNIAQYMITFYLGVVFAKHNLFDRAYDVIGHKPTLLFVALLVVVMIMRSFTPIVAINNTLYAPLIVLATAIIVKQLASVRQFLLFFGTLSTEIWLCHSFFIYYGFYKIAYISTNPWLVLSWVIVLSVLTSYILRYLFAFATICSRKIIKTISYVSTACINNSSDI